MSENGDETFESRVFVILSREGIFFLILSFSLLALGMIFDRLILIIPSLIFPIFFIIFGLFNFSKINEKLEFTVSITSNEIKAKQFLPVHIRLTDHGNRVNGVLSIEVSDGLFPVKTSQNAIITNTKTSTTFLFYAPRRGKEHILRLKYEFGGISGLFNLETRIVVDKEIIIVPEPQRVSLPWKMKQKILDQLVAEISIPVRGRGYDFLSLRDYQYGDEFKHIHWKATGKYRRLIVKEFEEPMMLRFLIVIDSSLLMAGPKLEFALSSAAEIASVVSKSNHSMMSVIAHGNNYSKLFHLGNSTAALRTLAINLHNVKTEGSRFNYTKLRQFILDNNLNGSVLIILSDLELDPEEVGAGIIGLKKYMQHIFFLACSTPGFGTLALANVQDTRMYDINQINYRRLIVEPELERMYGSKERKYKRKIEGENSKFRVIKGYNTNVLLELKEMLTSTSRAIRRGIKRVMP